MASSLTGCLSLCSKTRPFLSCVIAIGDQREINDPDGRRRVGGGADPNMRVVSP